jgi:hypothetical protein
MTTTKKVDLMEAYRLAKKVKCLAKAESKALLAITDSCSMRDRECRKSLSTMAGEYKDSVRQLKYGIHGRVRKDGSVYFPGLLERKVVYVSASGDGIPTTYKINMEVLRALALGIETSAQSSAQTSAQNSDDQCTSDAAPVHNEEKSSAQRTEKQCTGCTLVLRTVPKEQFKGEVSGEKPSPSIVPPAAALNGNSNGEPAGQGKPNRVDPDRLVTDIIQFAKLINPAAGFTEKSKRALRDALIELSRVTWGEIQLAVREKISHCDDFALLNFGSGLAAELVGSIRAQRVAETSRKDKVEQARKIKAEKLKATGGIDLKELAEGIVEAIKIHSTADDYGNGLTYVLGQDICWTVGPLVDELRKIFTEFRTIDENVTYGIVLRRVATCKGEKDREQFGSTFVKNIVSDYREAVKPENAGAKS